MITNKYIRMMVATYLVIISFTERPLPYGMIAEDLFLIPFIS